MNKRYSKSGDRLTIYAFLASILFVYIVLFEFVLPANKFLPKPSILIDTFPVLFKEYDFLSAFLYTIAAIYSVMIISYFLIRVGYKALYYISKNLPGLSALLIIGKYFLPIFLIFLFNLWFGSHILGEYLFILVVLMSALKSELITKIDRIPEEYLLSAKSLGLNEDELLSKVVFKSIQPKIFSIYTRDHLFLWSWTLIYEYICQTGGIGSVYFKALEYNDLSLVVLMSLILVSFFICMEFVLERIGRKYFFWN